jgi:hypothetical protein
MSLDRKSPVLAAAIVASPEKTNTSILTKPVLTEKKSLALTDLDFEAELSGMTSKGNAISTAPPNVFDSFKSANTGFEDAFKFEASFPQAFGSTTTATIPKPPNTGDFNIMRNDPFAVDNNNKTGLEDAFKGMSTASTEPKKPAKVESKLTFDDVFGPTPDAKAQPPAQTSQTGSTKPSTDSAVNELVDMGFTREKSLDALEKYIILLNIAGMAMI